MSTVSLIKTEQFEVAFKAITLLAISLTGAGFLIISMHDGRYGFIAGNPLRPRMIAAGFLFLLTIAIAVWSGYISNVMGRRRSTGTLEGVLVRSSFFLTLSPVLALVTSMVLSPSQKEPYLIAYLAPIFLSGLVSTIIIDELRRQTFRFPALWIVTTTQVAITDAFGTTLYHHSEKFSVWIWVLSVAFLVFVTFLLSEVTSRELLHIELGPALNGYFIWILLPLLLIGIFAQRIYSHISFKWGGGAPTSLVMTFTKDSALPGVKMKRLLVDETEQGYYVADAPSGQAHFVPRSSVALIDYEGTQH